MNSATICDSDGELDGRTYILLSDYDAEFYDINNPDLLVSYHKSPEDANSGASPINSEGSYFNGSAPAYNQSYYIRVLNTVTTCYNTTTLDIEIIDSPFIDLHCLFCLVRLNLARV